MLARSTPPPERYFIVGSCATRDAFDADNRLRLAGYVARSSFGSAFAAKPFPFSLAQLDPDRLTKSAFQCRMIGHDLAKELPGMLRQGAPERPLIIVDFIDERFSLLECDGALATYSLELMNVRCLDRHPEFRIIKSCSEEHFELWSKGFSAFAGLLRELELDVLINRVTGRRGRRAGKSSMSNGLISTTAILSASTLLSTREPVFLASATTGLSLSVPLRTFGAKRHIIIARTSTRD